MAETSMQRQVLITGASSDIGMALCRRYLEANYRVIAHVHRSGPEFEQLVTEAAGRILARPADFTIPSAVEEMVRREPELFSRMDALVNMAALREPVRFDDVTPDHILRHITANVVSAFTLIRILGGHMATRGWGRIVNVSSIGVKFGGGDKTFCYSLTKHTLEYMPAIVHKQWAKRNVLMNAIRVGITETRTFADMAPQERQARVSLIPANRMASPAEMAASIFSLGSEQNTFMTGQTITVAGGE
jgi:NAD(P)-dependent dehydrogenase (short-subunit alcohol dehydrogenase family)